MSSIDSGAPASVGSVLCLACGMCCDGTMFRDVELQSGDDSGALAAGGISIRSWRRRGPGGMVSGQSFTQPCAVLGGDCRCGIYLLRPGHCRNFDCALLQARHRGEVTERHALRSIRQARQLADTIRERLVELGDLERHRPLTQRVRRTQRRIFSGQWPAGLDRERAAECFGELAAAVGELQLKLRLEFYPDSPGALAPVRPTLGPSERR